ncbi:MAG: hypothetical protein LBS79_06960 [Tannerella sp.]|jgi:hypothetical protein|nr:hypothetical protein [Tannerella sp.]
MNRNLIAGTVNTVFHRNISAPHGTLWRGGRAKRSVALRQDAGPSPVQGLFRRVRRSGAQAGTVSGTKSRDPLRGLAVVLCAFGIFGLSCERESNYRFRGMPGEDVYVPPPAGGNYPSGGALVFHENFQSWKREGYENREKVDCEDDRMTTSQVMYVPASPRTADYNGFQVAYTLKDFAVSPDCDVKAGSSTADSEVSTGYVALQQLIFYECGQHDSDAMMQLSSLPSVSRVRFSVSLGGRMEDVAGITLWVKAGGQTAFSKAGDFIPSDPEAGETFSVDINERDVQLKFTPALTGRENPVNDGVNRAVRIHDLWIWSVGD